MPASAKGCLVVGVGAGLGAAFARRFASEYGVALVARTTQLTSSLAEEIRAGGGVAVPIQADMTDETSVVEAYERAVSGVGPIEVLIYNGGRATFGRLMETSVAAFEQCWRVYTLGAFLWARQVVPGMLSRGRGTILITGSASGVHARANDAAFAPAKFAVRGLAQAMARDLHPQGVHVAYVNVAGLVDMPLNRHASNDADAMIQPAAVADAFWYVAHQDRTTWTHELELRAAKESPWSQW
jgi:short-subunit dehydrogenase